jgi:katanin p60 ATPase-containing subunit A1
MSLSRYFNTAQCFSNEAHLTNQYQVCDNIDLGTIVQDFETYYYVRFQKYPKICKKIYAEENKKNTPKKLPNPENAIHYTTKPHVTHLINESQNNLHITKSFGKASSISVQKTLKSNNSSDFNLMVLPLTPEGFTNIQVNSTQNNVHSKSSEQLVKPLSGYATYSTEWKEFAEIISKVNFAQLSCLEFAVITASISILYQRIMGIINYRKFV